MWKIYNFLDNFYDFDQSSKSKKYIYNIFLPIFLILEYVCFIFIWKRIIIHEIFTNDEIVEFLDKNEFGYKNNKIYKKDLVSTNEFIDRFDLDEIKILVKKEFIESFAEKFKTVSFNIEDYLTLITDVDFTTVKKGGETIRERVYIVTLQYCRYFYIHRWYLKMLIWSISFGFFIILSKFLFHFINFDFVGNILKILFK